jgi:glycine cleavage system aminomethyltransferase T
MAGFNPKALVRDYGSIDGEARACREDCALFDFSFVARARIRGVGALAALGHVVRRRMDDLAPGRIRYAVRTRVDGTLISDLTIWNLGESAYEVMSGRHEDILDLIALAGPGVECLDLTGESAILAVQGPRSLKSLADLVATDLSLLPYFAHCETAVAGLPCRVGRLGYTGEAGFEILLSRQDGHRLWPLLAERVRPAGFAAADLLRIEAGLVLFANEFRFPVKSAEAGLARFDRADGQNARRRLVCFTASAVEPPILWHPPSAAAWPPARGQITVTSACWSPIAGGPLGLGYVPAGEARLGAAPKDPLGFFEDIKLVQHPFHDPAKQRVRAGWT